MDSQKDNVTEETQSVIMDIHKFSRRSTISEYRPSMSTSRQSISSHESIFGRMAGRKSSTRNLTRRIGLNIRPEEEIQQYYEDKFEERLVKKKPDWDAPRLSPETQLLAARSELAEIDHALDIKREIFAMKKNELNKMWKQLQNKQIDLKGSLIKYDKFIKENEVKKSRAERKAEEERNIQKDKDLEIQFLTERVTQLMKVKENLLQKVEEYKIYEDFLNKVLEASDEYEEMRGILSRYEALNGTREELMERHQKNLEDIEKQRTKMLKMTEEKMYDVMLLSNQLMELHHRYEVVQEQTYRWEHYLEKIKNTVADKTLELGQIKMACYNLYEQVCSFKNIKPSIPSEDIGAQLDYIQKSILDLNKLLKSLKLTEDKNRSSPNKTTILGKAKLK